MIKPFDLSGKVAVVTGSSKGIGRAIAECLAGMGAKVVVSSRKKEPCEAVAAGIREKGGDAAVITCNVSRREEVEALVDGTNKHFGGIDIMVCNAAVNPVFGPLATLTDEAFDKIMSSNVKAAIWFANLACPVMAARGGGALIIISSIGGMRGSEMLGAYGISKAADFSLARSLAVEWGPKNIRVNCVAPGLIKTDFARALWEDEAAVSARVARTPLRRLGTPEEIAGAAAFLATPAASYITGQVIVADGGVTIAGG